MIPKERVDDDSAVDVASYSRKGVEGWLASYSPSPIGTEVYSILIRCCTSQHTTRIEVMEYSRWQGVPLEASRGRMCME